MPLISPDGAMARSSFMFSRIVFLRRLASADALPPFEPIARASSVLGVLKFASFAMPPPSFVK
jgi:hypothetical protein